MLWSDYTVPYVAQCHLSYMLTDVMDAFVNSAKTAEPVEMLFGV